MSVADLKNLPNLPGFSYPQYKENHHKSQTWNVHNAQRVEQKHGLTHEKPKFVKAMRPQETWRTGSLPDSTTRANFKANAQMAEHTELPAWDAFDRHVLRFYGHFKEAVVETNLENHRMRKVMVYYYLEDDTCHVIEPRQDNSGIPQGQLIRRHRFPAPGGGYLRPEDLQVGGTVQIYGRCFLITDCDDFTRSYYVQAGAEQPGPLPQEQDPFAQTRAAMRVTKAAQPRTYEKIYREAMLGGGHINADMQQFMEWDRKVCRFYAVIDDLSLPQFERRPFLVLYFLADDTVEIREQYPLNSGRDAFPIFFGRRRMPRGVAKVHGPFEKALDKKECVRITDFSVGRVQELMGYSFFIYDADGFTRRYFEDELGQKLDECIDVRLPERAVPRPKTPPYTGYGSWDDSMGAVHSLLPKPPRKDVAKLYSNDGKVLHFTAQYANPKPEDVDRCFVVNFNLADDSLSIHEPPQRNLGIVTGKFLEQGVHVNQITGKLFQPRDLYPGAIIKVYNREFEIIDMDEYTRKYIEDPDAMRSFDLDAVLQKLREGLRQQYPLVRDIFRKFDLDHDGVLTMHEFRQALAKWGFQISEEESLVLMRHFDSRKDGQVSYNEFCDALLDEDYTTHMLKTKPPLQKSHSAAYAEKARSKVEERAETERVRSAVRALGDLIYQHTQALMKLLKEFTHMTHGQTVTCGQIVEALAQLGHTFDLEDVRRSVLFVLPNADTEHVNYVEFLKAMVASYHDSPAKH
mmetsp:Transcript_83438/g.269912  ORF Transcript_83438/g.269912 Transcript_83438/m.269912 type:complete len:744 (+) Transcript_83438:109-2340(+)